MPCPNGVIDNPETPDVIGIAGTMKYFAALGVELDEPACLAVHTELEAPTMGELHRDGFTKGWRSQNSETLTAQKTTSEHLRNSMVSDPSYFRRVYRYTFVLARPEGQKAVPLEIAIEYWRMMFSGKGILWQSGGLDFLGLYLDFLSESWKKTVSKDMWDQTGVFAAKCIEDPTLSWWNENGAWPGVLDEFVAYVMAKKEEGVERMEIE
jgi:DCN1-like protein 1/2